MASLSASSALLSQHRLVADKSALRISGSLSKQAGADGSSNRKSERLNGKVFQDIHADSVYGASSKQQQTLRMTTVPAATGVVDAKTELEPLEKIKAGFLKFKEEYKKDKELFTSLAQGQSPPFMIISCADSRVDPVKMLGLDLGDAFIVRNVANMVPSYSSSACSSTASAIEYAVLHLKVKHLMVIGHSRCGGIKALMGMKEDGSNKFSEFIEDWIVCASSASKKVKNLRPDISFDEQCTHCEKEAVNNSLWNLLSFPFVRDKVESGELQLHGAYYSFVEPSFERWTFGFAEKTESVKLA